MMHFVNNYFTSTITKHNDAIVHNNVIVLNISPNTIIHFTTTVFRV